MYNCTQPQHVLNKRRSYRLQIRHESVPNFKPELCQFRAMCLNLKQMQLFDVMYMNILLFPCELNEIHLLLNCTYTVSELPRNFDFNLCSKFASNFHVSGSNNSNTICFRKLLRTISHKFQIFQSILHRVCWILFHLVQSIAFWVFYWVSNQNKNSKWKRLKRVV